MRLSTDGQFRPRQAALGRLLSRFRVLRLHTLFLTVVVALAFAFGLGVAQPDTLHADQTGSLRDAVLRVLRRRFSPSDVAWNIVALRQVADWAYAAAVPVADQRTLPRHPTVVLARLVNGQWGAAGEDTPDAFDALLNSAPETLLAASTKSMLRLPTSAPVAATALASVTGYRLPFTLNAFACVVQTDIQRISACAGNVSGHGYPAVDFDIENGGEDGDVVAAKDGVVVFRKDASNAGSPDPNNWTYGNLVVIKSAPTEYVWYLHLRQSSIPTALQVGSTVRRGQKIGVEGTTGWSTGVHLHFNVATSYNCCLNPNDPVRVMPYWPGSDYTNMQKIDFDEYPWSVLQQTDTAISSNASPDCSTPSPGANQVALYDLRGYCGAYQVFNIGNYADPFRWTLPNDSASAIKVGSSVSAIACLDWNFGAPCQTFLNDEPDLSTQPIGDNQVSSLMVIVRPPPPSAPSLLEPPNGITVSADIPVTLTWNVNADQSYVEITSTVTGLASFGWQTETYRGLVGLPPGNDYLWHVKARNAGGESAWSQVRAFIVRPAAPTNLAATPHPCGAVDLSWLGRSSTAVGYNIYRNGVLIAQTDANAYSDAGASPNSDVLYVVTAFSNGLESDATARLSIHTPPCGRLAYIYSTDAGSATSFTALLAGKGYAVDLITPTLAAAFDFTTERTVVIADDATGWPTSTISTVGIAGTPVVGIGQGGADFFRQLGLDLGATNATSGLGSDVRVVNGEDNVWWFPSLMPGGSGGVVTLYNSGVPYIALPSITIGGVLPLGQLSDDSTRAPFIAQQVGGQCYLLWGWRSVPAGLTTSGQQLFLNSLLTQPCGTRLQLDLPLVGR